jgi:hypothetical protein
MGKSASLGSIDSWLERHLRLADRRGIFQRQDLSRVQEFGLLILYEADQISSFVSKQQELADRLRLAIVTHDPSRLPIMFPAFAPAEANNETAIKAMDSNDPVEIKTEVSVEDALRMLTMMDASLSIDDLTIGDI